MADAVSRPTGPCPSRPAFDRLRGGRHLLVLAVGCLGEIASLVAGRAERRRAILLRDPAEEPRTGDPRRTRALSRSVARVAPQRAARARGDRSPAAYSGRVPYR